MKSGSKKTKKTFRIAEDVALALEVTAKREKRTETVIVEEALRQYCMNADGMLADLRLLREALEKLNG